MQHTSRMFRRINQHKTAFRYAFFLRQYERVSRVNLLLPATNKNHTWTYACSNILLSVGKKKSTTHQAKICTISCLFTWMSIFILIIQVISVIMNRTHHSRCRPWIHTGNHPSNLLSLVVAWPSACEAQPFRAVGLSRSKPTSLKSEEAIQKHLSSSLKPWFIWCIYGIRLIIIAKFMGWNTTKL